MFFDSKNKFPYQGIVEKALLKHRMKVLIKFLSYRLRYVLEIMTKQNENLSLPSLEIVVSEHFETFLGCSTFVTNKNNESLFKTKTADVNNVHDITVIFHVEASLSRSIKY